MKKVIVVHGLKRSGNHAIINWLKSHGSFIFFNNVIPIAPILKGRKNFPPPEDFNQWLRRKLLPRNLQFAYFLMKIALRKRSLIVSLEDHDLNVKPFLRVPCDVTNILIIRDPYNLFSSRIRKSSLVKNPAYPKNTGPAMNRVLKLWKSHAREYLGETNHLENKTCIYFNSWFANRDYRQSVSRTLNVEFTDHGFFKVSKIGGGSSFDKTNFDGSNQMMNVLDRRSSLTDYEQRLLKDILADDELRELADRITKMNHVSVLLQPKTDHTPSLK